MPIDGGSTFLTIYALIFNSDHQHLRLFGVSLHYHQIKYIVRQEIKN